MKFWGLVKRFEGDARKRALEKFHSPGSNVDEVLAQLEAELSAAGGGGPYAPADSGTSGGTGPASGSATSGGGDPVAGDSGPVAGGDTPAVADAAGAGSGLEGSALGPPGGTGSVLSKTFGSTASFGTVVKDFNDLTDDVKEIEVMREVFTTSVTEPGESSSGNSKKAYKSFKKALDDPNLDKRKAAVAKALPAFLNKNIVRRDVWDEMLAEAKARIEEAARKTKVVGQWSRVRRGTAIKTKSNTKSRSLAPVRRRPVAAVRSTAVSKARRAPVKRKRSSVAAASSSAKSARRPGK
eukprot:jgi/Mesvir1/27878/Mv20065-RA.1